MSKQKVNIIAKYFFYTSILLRVMPHIVYRIIIGPKNEKPTIAFIGHCYYSFDLLSSHLRRRGFDSITVNLHTSLDHVKNFISQKVDKNLYSSNQKQYLINLAKFYKELIQKYNLIHLYGSFSIFPDKGAIDTIFMLLLKLCGIKIGYTPSGCLDASTQSDIYKLTSGLCDKCIWQKRKDVCSDTRNLKKILKLNLLCDLLPLENDLPTKSRLGKNCFKDPLTCVIDSKLWHKNLVVPNSFKIHKTHPDEIIILTAFGNEDSRSNSDYDIKGKRYIHQAILAMKSKGYKINHVHASNIESQNMKYLQSQADIIIDQIHYGTIGAFSREGMMLSKPVICYVTDLVRQKIPAMHDCPVISANSITINKVLENLIHTSTKTREQIGAESRKWMLKWYDAKVCAARYEQVYYKLLNKQSIQTSDSAI